MSKHIDVWIHCINDWESPCYAMALSEMEEAFQKKVNAYQFSKDKIRKVAGRMLLQKAVRDADASIYIPSELTFTQFKKPVLKKWKAFNLSYSGNMVVLAFAEEALGIDIEYHKEIDFQSMLACFHKEERLYVEKNSNALKAFYEVWVKKEALVKAEGIGLNDDLDKMNCSQSLSTYFGKSWYFHSVPIQNDYTCYLCSGQKEEEIKITYYTAEELVNHKALKNE